MTKQLICISLILTLIFGFAPVNAAAAETEIGLRPLSAGEPYAEMVVSRNMLDMIKDVEGFCATPYWDVNQWTIGYGTACGYRWGDKPNLTVTREEAEKMLLIDVSEKYGKIVNDYCASISRQPNQHQFDALVDFTYNLGGNWTRGCMLTDWLEDPTTEQDFLNAIGRWGRVSSKANYATSARRIREAIVFMKGEYYLTYGGGSFETELSVVSNHDLPYYKLVIYQCDGGNVNGLSTEMSYHFAGEPYGELYEPVRPGHTFAGWLVTKERSVTLSEPYPMDSSMLAEENLHLTAQWIPNETTEPEPTDPTEPAPTEPTEPEVTEPAPTEPEVTEPDVTEPENPGVLMVVNTDVLKVRSGPDTTYDCLDLLTRGTQVRILEETMTGTMRWGRTEQGWVCMDYLCLPGEETPPEPTEPEPTEPEPVYATVNTAVLKVRSGPDTTYDCVANLTRGTRVEILEETTVNDLPWGRIEEGWICLSYVTFDSETPKPTDPPADETQPTEPPAQEPAFPFTDVSQDSQHREYVEYVYAQGYMKGVSADRFDTEGSMTRAMIVTVLYRMAGEPEVDLSQSNQFTDVQSSDYFAKAVAWAKENGIVMGVSATEFAPNRKVIRQDAVTIFHRYYVNYLGKDGQASAGLDRFADCNMVSDYANTPMAWAVEAEAIGWESAADGLYLAPRADLTRGQAARLMYMLDKLLGNAQ